MLNGVLTRWELTPDEKFQKFYQELQEYLKEKLIYSPLSDGKDYWILDFNYTDYMDGYLPDADPFRHSRHFCEERHYYWPEVREMISDHLGDWILDDAEIVNGFEIFGERSC
jgi:hypothetical protein